LRKRGNKDREEGRFANNIIILLLRDKKMIEFCYNGTIFLQ